MRRSGLVSAVGVLALGLAFFACTSDPEADGTPSAEQDGGNGSSGSSGEPGTGSSSGGSSSGDAAIPGVPTRLDPTCAGVGRAVFRGGIDESVDFAHSVHRRSDGTTLFIGTVDEPTPVASIQSQYIASIRLAADCSLDTTWGSNGLRFLTVANPDFHTQHIGHVDVLPDGRSLVVGNTIQEWQHPTTSTTSTHFALTAIRLNADGSQDSGFGTQFMHTQVNPDDQFPADFTVKGAVSLPDGSTRILGQTGGPYMSFVLATLTAAGTFDPAATRVFAKDRSIGADYEVWRIRGLLVLADGSTLVSGTFTGLGNTASQLPGIVKIKADGTVDTTFGTRGVAGLASAGGPETRTEMRLTADSKILLASVITTPESFNSVAVMRFDAAGVIDLSFGVNGVASVDLGTNAFVGDSNATQLKAFVLNADGSMTLGGELYSLDADDGTPESEWHIAATRFLANGALDTSFGNGGVFNAAPLSVGAREYLAGLHQDENGTVTLSATRELSQYDSDWVVYRLNRQP